MEIELRGKYNNAFVFTDNIEAEAVSQIIQILNQPQVEGQKVRIMPDVHAGKGCTIGTTMTITDKVIPNLVGVDIGCGMAVANLGKIELNENELKNIDKAIREYVPSGQNIRGKIHNFLGYINLSQLYCYEAIKDKINRIELSIGTLGGGNHFIEIDKNDEGIYYLVVHSGSRYLGVAVATYYQNEAYRFLTKKYGKDTQKKIIEQLTKEGRQQDIQTELNKIKSYNFIKELAYCEDELFEQYIHDMRITQNYADLNRLAILSEIYKQTGLVHTNIFTTIHNYIDIDNMILRKGAVSAQKDEKLIIPINMRDGSLICRGKGNSNWNYSAPHGAGRIMSRSKAKEILSLKEYRDSMKGIYSTSINFDTIDEAPMAYKPMEEIINNIKDTVEILDIIKPVYNFKANT